MLSMGTKLTKVLNFTKLENFVPFIIVLVILCAAKPALHNKQVRVIVIDAGHGGKDPGCNYNGVKEKDVTLQIALATGKKIQELLPDVKIIYTRNSDRFIELHQRAEIANKAEADLFISIHCNANKNVNVSGTETFAMGLHKANDNLDVSMRENGAILLESNYQENYEGFDPNSPETHIILSLYQNAYLEKSLKLASKIEQNLGKQIERFSRGVKQAGFLVLWQTKMPSILIETGFLSNKSDREMLNSENGVDKISAGIARSVADYKQLGESSLVKN
jgi:N-acetylmuramoyl-L-alanine amidase